MIYTKVKVKQSFAVLLWGWLLSSWVSLLGCPCATSPSFSSQHHPWRDHVWQVPGARGKSPSGLMPAFLGYEEGGLEYCYFISIIAASWQRVRIEEKQRINYADTGKPSCEILSVAGIFISLYHLPLH